MPIVEPEPGITALDQPATWTVTYDDGDELDLSMDEFAAAVNRYHCTSFAQLIKNTPKGFHDAAEIAAIVQDRPRIRRKTARFDI